MIKFNIFLQKFPTRSFAKGEIILLKDERPRNLYIIKSGAVKVYDITKDGEERPIAFDKKGEIFPIGWAVGFLESTQYFYEAFTDCTVYALPRDDFINYLKTQPDVAFYKYEKLAQRMISLQERILGLEQSKAADKILFTLSYLAKRFGEPINSSTSQLKIPLTQQELANFLGLTRETTSIELKKLEKGGYISYSRHNYFIHTAKVKKALE